MSHNAAGIDAKEQIRQAIDIVDLVGGYMQLRRQGRNYVGLCPWHDDSRPSFQVNQERQSFKCWVCDYGGDIFSFFMRIEGVEFREALEMLAERAGVSLALSGGNKRPTEAGSPDDRKTLFRAMDWAEQQFHAYLRDSIEAEPARVYLEERGVTRESLEKFHLGFSPDRWDWLLNRARDAGFSPQVLERVGLVIARNEGQGHYDRFRGRVLFSIRDVQHRAIALGGRILPQPKGTGGDSNSEKEQGAKYINSPETPLFSKSAQLYGLDIARDAVVKAKQLIVVEGYTDCIALNQHGIENVVAVLGTALTERHVPLIRRFADSVTLVLDGDEAGQRRTKEILELFVAAQLDLRILTLPQNLDPCDFIGRHGRQAFDQLQSEAVDALEFKIRTVTQGLDPAVQTHQAHEALEDILSTVARAPRAAAVADSSLHLREQQILSRLARSFAVPEENLRERLRSLRSTPRRGANVHSSPAEGVPAPRFVSLSEVNTWDRELLELLLEEPELISRMTEVISLDDLRDTICRRVLGRCIQLHESGVVANFERLMLETEDPAMKNFLVQLDESRQAKDATDREGRLDEVLKRYSIRREDTQHRAATSALREGQLDESQQEDLLNDLFETLRSRQTGSEPTEG